MPTRTLAARSYGTVILASTLAAAAGMIALSAARVSAMQHTHPATMPPVSVHAAGFDQDDKAQPTDANSAGGTLNPAPLPQAAGSAAACAICP
jgi:hypothetical protein